MNFGLFLGAGASKPLGKPTTKEFKEKITSYDPEKTSDEEILQSFLNIYDFPDIEHVLQAIKDIKSLANNKGGHYLYKMVKDGKLTFNLYSCKFPEFIEKIEKIEKIIERKIFEEYHWKKQDDEIVNDIHGVIIDYLTRLGKLSIFTTNYDSVIEELCDYWYEKYKLIDGFIRNPPDRDVSIWEGYFDEYENRNPTRSNIHYYKLHGSLNWKRHVKHGIVKTNEESIPLDSKFTENILIFPTLNPKYEEENEPFVTIIKEFKKNMMELDACIVIGFSFRDSMSYIFEDFLKDGKSLVVISPTGHQDFLKEVVKYKKSKRLKRKVIKINKLFGAEVDLHFIQDEINTKNTMRVIKQLQKLFGKPHFD